MLIFNTRYQLKILGFLFVVAALVWGFVFVEARQNDFLEIVFFDVGQGDGIFVETIDGKQILVDGGPDAKILEKLGKKMAFYDRYIDIVVLTHPEADHLNGLIEVIKRYNIGAIITTGVVRDTNQYKEFVKIIEQKNIPIYIAKSGGEIDFGNNIKIDILYPFENMAGLSVSNTNNSSIVGKLIYNNFEVLLTGDIEKSVERKLVSFGIDLQADVLKIAHHGSKTSTAEEFLIAVNPIIAVIQAGKDNKYGHPHQEVLERMANVLTLISGMVGDIKILSDGEEFLIK